MSPKTALHGPYAADANAFPAVPLIVGDRVFWAWTSGALGVAGDGRELFRVSFDNVATFGTPRLVLGGGRLIVATPSAVEGGTHVHWLDPETGAVVASAHVAELEELFVSADRLHVFTRHVPHPDEVTVATDRLDELGEEGALEALRDDLAFKRRCYEDPAANMLFPNGEVLTFDLASGKLQGRVAVGQATESRLAVLMADNHFVIAPIDVPGTSERVEDSLTTRVHALDGTLAWSKPVRLVTAASGGVLVRDDQHLCLLAVADGRELWRREQPIEEDDMPIERLTTSIGGGAIFQSGPPAEKTKQLTVRDLATGEERWSATVSSSSAVPTPTGEVAWLSDEKDQPTAYPLATGEPVVSINAKGVRHLVGTRSLAAFVTKPKAYALSVFAIEG